MSATISSGGGGGGDTGRKRTITIDPSLQMFSKKASRKAKQRSDKSATLKPKPFIRPNTLKKNLLDRIKKHQQKQNDRGVSSSPAVTPSSVTAASTGDSAETYLQSLQYLQNISSNISNKHKSSGGKTSKSDRRRDNSQQYPSQLSQQPSQLSQPSQQPNVYLEAPSALFGNTNTNNTITNASSNQPIAIAAASSSNINNMVVPMQISEPLSNTFQIMQPQEPFQVKLPAHADEFQPLFSNEPIIPVNMTVMAEPKWGCLKGGTKPTFRSLHNKTLRSGTGNNAVTHQNPLIMDKTAIVMDPIDLNAINPNSGNNHNSTDITDATDTITTTPTPTTTSTTEMSGGSSGGVGPITESGIAAAATNDIIDSMYGIRKQRLDEYRREHIENAIKSQEPDIKIRETKQHVVTKKYKLGKYVNRNGPVIGVLIKNRQTQHSIEKKRKELRNIPLRTITARLHKKNLLKVGSSAPPDILRELYENAVFAGDIENDGEGILLHNFLSTSEQIEN